MYVSTARCNILSVRAGLSWKTGPVGELTLLYWNAPCVQKLIACAHSYVVVHEVLFLLHRAL